MPILVSWSSGKDSAWMLHVLRQQGHEVKALLTSLVDGGGVSMHGTPLSLLQAQAQACGLPLWTVTLPWPCPNDEYARRMATVCQRALEAGMQEVAFGDLYLQDVRAYRESMLAGTGLNPIFPLWQRPTRLLAEEMIAAGLRAHLVCVDTEQLDSRFLGRVFDQTLLRELPPHVDQCGEGGEFHTFVSDGPMFTEPVPYQVDGIDEDSRFPRLRMV
jgi:uncharacterized protein (TIGR00290 family)